MKKNREWRPGTLKGWNPGGYNPFSPMVKAALGIVMKKFSRRRRRAVSSFALSLTLRMM